MTTSVGNRPQRARPANMIPADWDPTEREIEPPSIVRLPWLRPKLSNEVRGADSANVNLRPESGSQRLFCYWASSPVQFSATPSGTAVASHGSSGTNILVSASARMAGNLSTVDGLEFRRRGWPQFMHSQKGGLWSSLPESSLLVTHAEPEPGQHWGLVGPDWQTAPDYTISAPDADLGVTNLRGGWPMHGDDETFLSWRMPLLGAPWQVGSASTTGRPDVIEPAWKKGSARHAGTPYGVASATMSSTHILAESMLENPPMARMRLADPPFGWVLQSDKVSVGHILGALAGTSQTSFGSGREEAKAIQDFATIMADVLREFEPSPSPSPEWELEWLSIIEEFSAGVSGETPDLSTIAMARRLVRVAYECTNNTFISVDDEEGDLDFDLRLVNGFIVMANVFADGTIDASVYDDSDGIPVKTVRRFRRGQATEQDLVSLFRTESNANIPQSYAVSFHQEPQGLLASTRAATTSTGV